ncbi:OprO/OprP family phosphate-selective porin [Candidatus Methylopumilus turicensis]|uniref:Putative Phosphate-selective porin O and P superfamily protein n=1 Tax=Candidatus Methylopumilus turicensis TaxID=1581680 RepID=A0A0B7IYP9_9PROT|nr:porin [Candidatus Methylopumilus turicensis]CEN55551.1 putative Phosphate-selective porin O and P superfamily protein [Candidatus Methylopumilus turicensis]
MKSIKMRGVVAAVAGALMFGFGANAMADSTDDILNALIAKGVLTEEEGALLQKGREGEKLGASKKPKTTEKDGAFTLESGNGNTTMAVTGRLHFDMHNSNLDFATTENTDKDTASAADQFEIRRARIGVKGKLAKDFKYEAVTNLVGGTPTIDVAFLDWAKYDQGNIRFGKFKQPFNLEELTSSNNITFMERSYVNQLAPAKKLGVMFSGEGRPGFTYAASGFQFNDTELSYKGEDLSYAGRTTLNFAEIMGDKTAIYHVGLSGFDTSYAVRPTTSSSASGGTTSSGSIMSFRGSNRGLSNIFRAQIEGDTTVSGQSVASDNSSQVSAKALGLEGIVARGPFKLQGEYVRSDYKANYNDVAKMSLDANAWYAEAAWMITGESYADSYKKGVFGAIKPKSMYDMDGGKGWGAWELAFRAEGYNVENGSLTGGASSSRFQGNLSCASGSSETINTGSSKTAAQANCESGAKSYTAGLRWIANPNLLFKLNYTYTKFDYKWDHFDTEGTKFMDNEQVMSLRGQWMF